MATPVHRRPPFTYDEYRLLPEDGKRYELMEGDLSRTIKANLDLIGHIHTGGVPGRSNLDDRQEVNWRAIAGLLRHLGYSHWVGHEFVPRGDPIAALKQALALFASDAGVTES